MLRLSAFVLVVLLMPLSAMAESNGEQMGETIGRWVNGFAEKMRDEGPDLVDKAQDGMGKLVARAEPVVAQTKTVAANVDDYRKFCGKNGFYRDRPICQGLQFSFGERSAFSIVFSALSEHSGTDVAGNANKPQQLGARLVDVLGAAPSSGDTVSVNDMIRAIYINLNECAGNSNGNKGCHAPESQGEEFVPTLQEILTYLEGIYGVSGNDTAAAIGLLKEAFSR